MALQVVVVFGLKLIFSVAAFLGTSYFGRFFDKRTTGVLLTFPILNVIGLLSAPDPARTAETIYVVVVWNTVLFTGTITWLLTHRRSSANSDAPAVWPRFASWVLCWGVGATAITAFLDLAPGPVWMFALTLGLMGACVVFWWSAGSGNGVTPSLWDRANHRVQFREFWDANLKKRLVFFAVVLLVIQVSSIVASDSKWTGMFSACPLPGIFALATLSLTLSADELRRIRDTVLLGPILVIPFNLLFAQVPQLLPSQWYLALPCGLLWGVLFWTVSAVLVFAMVPVLSRFVDRWKRVGWMSEA